MIERLRLDIRDFRAETNTTLASFVTAQVHEATERRLDQRIEGVQEDVREVRTDQERDRQIARQARQFAITTAVAVAATAIAYFAVMRDPTAPAALGGLSLLRALMG